MKEFLWWLITDGGSGGFGTPFNNLIFGIAFVMIGFVPPMDYLGYTLIVFGIFIFLAFISQVLLYYHS